MLKSMTGFGAGRAVSGSEELTVELKSVNHKFCEVKARLPRELGSLESGLVRRVKERIARGALELTVKRTGATAAGTAPVVDLALAQGYRRALGELAQALGLPDTPRIQDVAFQPGVLRLEERGANLEEAERAVMAALEQALESLSMMRLREGAALQADLDARLAAVEGWVSELKRLAPLAVAEHHQRLRDRLAELLRGGELEPQRIAQEVALFAERTDVAEELTRLASHLAQFRELCAAPEPAGRKLDFLLQEMNREVNTTGSKSQHAEVSSRIVALKAELERIREQIQNVE